MRKKLSEFSVLCRMTEVVVCDLLNKRVATFILVPYRQQIAEHSAPAILQSIHGRIPHYAFRKVFSPWWWWWWWWWWWCRCGNEIVSKQWCVFALITVDLLCHCNLRPCRKHNDTCRTDGVCYITSERLAIDNELRITFGLVDAVWGSHASWKVLKSTRFFGQIFRSWKVLEHDLGPWKSWKLHLAILESPGKVKLLASVWVFGQLCNFATWDTIDNVNVCEQKQKVNG